MDQFVTDCPACSREACLDTNELRLLVPTDASVSARVVFSCPTCGRRATVGVVDQVADALLATGVATSYGHPSLGGARQRPPELPAFTHDDLLDFHLVLQDEGWFEQLAALPSR